MWRAQVEALERLGHRTLAIDLPGHGARTGEAFTLEGAAAAVHDGVRALTEGPTTAAPGAHPPRDPTSARGTDDPAPEAVVVGLSLGAYVTLHALARDARGVGAVVAAGCCTPPTSAMLYGWALLARGIVAMPDGGARLNQRMAELALPPQAAVDLAAGGFALDVMDDVLREMRAARPLEDLAAIAPPVWIVNGRFDHFRTRERAFVRAGRDVRLRVIGRAKHLVSLDQPVRFTRVILEALAIVEERALDRPGPVQRAEPRRAGI
ncbi:MAG: alpha/beta hydrolase [Actinomycetales bacterium]|nr:alpha/beta hydrolase [Actinomycetales bacterium]